MAQPNPISALTDDPRLVEMRRRFTYAQNEWKDIREEGKRDMQVCAGDPWDPKDKRQRIDAGRPALVLDEIGQYVNQLVNDVRQHQRAIQVTPLGDGANDKTAQFRQDLIRQIEYRSKAQDAYTTGFENAVQRSYGYWRVNARYCSEKLSVDGTLNPSLLDQELVIEPIMNPDLVLIDPDFQRPDGSDMRWAFIYERWPVDDYKQRWPKATVRDANPDLMRACPDWVQAETIQVCEYWTIDTSDRVKVWADKKGKVHRVDNGDDVPKGAKSRWVSQPKVTKLLSNGLEVLEEQDWPGTQIPLVCDFGKMLYVDSGGGPKRKILSLVRLARDPYMLYCYYRTCEAELVGMTPKFPYFVREGSLATKELDNLKRSLSQPIAVIQVRNQTSANATPPEFPQRQPYEPPIQALEMGAESARRAIQAAMGSMPLPTQAQGDNEKSGIALDKITSTTQQGTYHFVDHYEAAITRTGVILEELIPHYYDTPRTVAVRSATGKVSQQRINDTPTPDEPAVPVDEADHDVTLSTGPSYQSERVAGDAFVSDLVNRLPQLMPIVGQGAAVKMLAAAIKLRNVGPIGDEMVEFLTPPDPSGLPPQIAQQMQQLTQENQQLKQAIATGTAKIQAKAQADIQVAQAEAQLPPTAADAVKLKIADMTSARSAQSTIGAAAIKAGDAQEDRYIQTLEIMLNVAKEARLQAADHQSKQALQDSANTHATLELALEHKHDHDMAEQAHQHGMASAAQAAALTPAPTPGAPDGQPGAADTGA
jgi:hypothetical protein